MFASRVPRAIGRDDVDEEDGAGSLVVLTPVLPRVVGASGRAWRGAAVPFSTPAPRVADVESDPIRDIFTAFRGGSCRRTGTYGSFLGTLRVTRCFMISEVSV